MNDAETSWGVLKTLAMNLTSLRGHPQLDAPSAIPVIRMWLDELDPKNSGHLFHTNREARDAFIHSIKTPAAINFLPNGYYIS